MIACSIKVEISSPLGKLEWLEDCKNSSYSIEMLKDPYHFDISSIIGIRDPHEVRIDIEIYSSTVFINYQLLTVIVRYYV